MSQDSSDTIGLYMGLAGSLATYTGAKILGSDIANKEAVTVLVGGLINGGLTSMLFNAKDKLMPSKGKALDCYFENPKLRIMSAIAQLTAQLTAQMMGELILDKGTEWAPTVIDALLGSLTIAGGALVLARTCEELTACSSSMFQGSTNVSISTNLLSNSTNDIEQHSLVV